MDSLMRWGGRGFTCAFMKGTLFANPIPVSRMYPSLSSNTVSGLRFRYAMFLSTSMSVEGG